MKKSPRDVSGSQSRDQSQARDTPRRAGTGAQPPATGAGRGSPAAPVMKQFARTRAESKGRS